MIKVVANITITLEDGTTIEMSKHEAEQLYSQLYYALGKEQGLFPTKPFNPDEYTMNRNTVTC